MQARVLLLGEGRKKRLKKRCTRRREEGRDAQSEGIAKGCEWIRAILRRKGMVQESYMTKRERRKREKREKADD